MVKVGVESAELIWYITFQLVISDCSVLTHHTGTGLAYKSMNMILEFKIALDVVLTGIDITFDNKLLLSWTMLSPNISQVLLQLFTVSFGSSTAYTSYKQNMKTCRTR